MSDFFQSLADLAYRVAVEPEARSQALLAGILVALSTLAVRRKKDRVQARIDAPRGTSVTVTIGRDGEQQEGA